MKWKRRCTAWAALLCLMAMLMMPAAAAERTIRISLNGDPLNIPPSFGASFYDEHNRLQIPMRYIIQSCGYDVLWNNADKTAIVPTTAGDLVITIGSDQLRTPQGVTAMDTAALIRGGRTYLPLRFVLEALGFQVTWSRGPEADLVEISGQIGASSSRVPMTPTEISAMAAPAVFYVEVYDADGRAFASGSGFFIDPSGIGVTNYHVIEDAWTASLLTPEGARYNMGTVLYHDPVRDLVVFQALPEGSDSPAMNLPHLGLAASGSIRNGDPVYAIGSPYGLQNTITDGLVSNADRVLPEETLHYIQTSAPISSGNSGGPLLNQYGEVIGINSATLTGGQNLNLAIPVRDLSRVNYLDPADDTTLSVLAGGSQSPDADLPADLTPPSSVHVVQRLEHSVVIQWAPVPEADYYHFYHKQAGESSFWYEEDPTWGGPMRYDKQDSCRAEFTGLFPGVTYHVIITAVRNGAESAHSEVLTFTFSK